MLMVEEQKLGSETAKRGFKNEKDIVLNKETLRLEILQCKEKEEMEEEKQLKCCNLK